MARSTSAHRHPTVKPDQLRRDEVRLILRGSDLNDRVVENVERSIENAVRSKLAIYGINPPDLEIEIENGREPK